MPGLTLLRHVSNGNAMTSPQSLPPANYVIAGRLVCLAARPAYVTRAAWQTLMIRCQTAYRQARARSGRRWRLRLRCGAIREDGLQALHRLRLERLGVRLQRN